MDANETVRYCRGYQRSDCRRHVGQVLAGPDGYMIVTRVGQPVDTDEGQKPWSQEYAMRPCTAGESAAAEKAAKIAKLEKTIRGLAGGPDDERCRQEHDAKLAAAQDELATLTA